MEDPSGHQYPVFSTPEEPQVDLEEDEEEGPSEPPPKKTRGRAAVEALEEIRRRQAEKAE